MTKFTTYKAKRLTELEGLIEGKHIVVDSLKKKKDMTIDKLNALIEASKNKSDKEIEKAQSKLDKLKKEYEGLVVLREKALTEKTVSEQNERIPENSQDSRDETYSVGSC
jgi:hypothetical protein